MHILVATDGALDTEKAAPLVARLAGEDGTVTVLSVVEIPRRMLTELRAVYGERPPPSVDADGEYVGISKDRPPPVGWPGDDAMVERYLADKRDEVIAPILRVLAEAGVSANGEVLEGENAAAVILAAVKDQAADVICLGSHGSGRFEGLLGSTGTKVTRHSPCPVLVIR
ncbi:MAG: universal stress protein [Acidimicrobiia bacterium]|nr:universal stress protein [Acidimicrobiia bacterium]